MICRSVAAGGLDLASAAAKVSELRIFFSRQCARSVPNKFRSFSGMLAVTSP